MNKFPVIDLEATGERIERLRKEKGYTVRDLQEEFEFTSPQAIYKWQKGMSLPTVENLIMLSRMLGTSIEGLLALESDREQETGVSRHKSVLFLF